MSGRGVAGSLRWRLLLGAASAILLALCVAWALMTLLFERHLEHRLQADMTRDALQLVAALSFAPDGSPVLAESPGDARLRQPAGGYYWQVTSGGGALRSRSLWDSALPVPADPPADDWRLRRAAGPFGQQVLVLERRLIIGSNRPATVVQFAQDARAIAVARGEFARELALFLIVLWLLLSAAAWLQVTLGLRPLARVRDELAELEKNANARLPPPALRETSPLVEAINALADARERELERARRRAADLAHGLKTPLAALAAQSRRAREAGADGAADGMDRAIAAIGRVVDGELARMRLARLGKSPGTVCNVRSVAERLINVLEHTEKGERLVFGLDVPERLQLDIGEEHVSEILGALLENATLHARRQVRIVAEAGADWTRLLIEDDGEGIDPARREQALLRGVRLDESGESGSGLGLAIARELVEANAGTLRLLESSLGGLQVLLVWDACRPSAVS